MPTFATGCTDAGNADDNVIAFRLRRSFDRFSEIISYSALTADLYATFLVMILSAFFSIAF